MIEETILRLEAKLCEADSLTPARREELLGLLRQLKGELTGLEKTHSDEARLITQHAERSAERAKDPELLEGALKELSQSVEGFEDSHPQLVQVVNRIATTLSNLGI